MIGGGLINERVLAVHRPIFVAAMALALTNIEMICWLPWTRGQTKLGLPSDVGEFQGYPSKTTLRMSFSTVVFEDLPQLLIQLCFIFTGIDGGGANFVTVGSVVSSLLNICYKGFSKGLGYMLAPTKLHAGGLDPSTAFVKGLSNARKTSLKQVHTPPTTPAAGPPGHEPRSSVLNPLQQHADGVTGGSGGADRDRQSLSSLSHYAPVRGSLTRGHSTRAALGHSHSMRTAKHANRHTLTQSTPGDPERARSNTHVDTELLEKLKRRRDELEEGGGAPKSRGGGGVTLESAAKEEEERMASGEVDERWQEALDVTTGKNYYFNAEGKTSWEPPPLSRDRSLTAM